MCFQPSRHKKNKLSSQMRVKLQFTFFFHCDRNGVSDCAAAAIVSSFLEDIVVITEKDTSQIIERLIMNSEIRIGIESKRNVGIRKLERNKNYH